MVFGQMASAQMMTKVSQIATVTIVLIGTIFIQEIVELMILLPLSQMMFAVLVEQVNGNKMQIQNGQMIINLKFLMILILLLLKMMEFSS